MNFRSYLPLRYRLETDSALCTDPAWPTKSKQTRSNCAAVVNWDDAAAAGEQAGQVLLWCQRLRLSEVIN
jgi:hypothetical protein